MNPYVTPLDNLHGWARRFRKDLLRYHDPAHGGQIVPLTELERRYLAGELAEPQHKALYAALAAEHGPTTMVDRLSGLILRITRYQPRTTTQATNMPSKGQISDARMAAKKVNKLLKDGRLKP
jgi:hypothetical protein